MGRVRAAYRAVLRAARVRVRVKVRVRVRVRVRRPSSAALSATHEALEPPLGFEL
jgi:hypothetical protein